MTSPASVPPATHLGSLLRLQRKTRKMTQEQLAQVFDVRPQTVGAWESGERPQFRFHSGLADFMGLNGPEAIGSLLDRSDDPPNAEDQDPPAEIDPKLEIRLNISRRIATGEPPTAVELELWRALLSGP